MDDYLRMRTNDSYYYVVFESNATWMWCVCVLYVSLGLKLSLRLPVNRLNSVAFLLVATIPLLYRFERWRAMSSKYLGGRSRGRPCGWGKGDQFLQSERRVKDVIAEDLVRDQFWSLLEHPDPPSWDVEPVNGFIIKAFVAIMASSGTGRLSDSSPDTTFSIALTR